MADLARNLTLVPLSVRQRIIELAKAEVVYLTEKDIDEIGQSVMHADLADLDRDIYLSFTNIRRRFFGKKMDPDQP